MASSEMLRRVTLVRIDVSEERRTSIITEIRICELETTLAVSVFIRRVRRLIFTSNVVPILPIFVTLMMEAICCSEASVHKRDTRRHIPKVGIQLLVSLLELKMFPHHVILLARIVHCYDLTLIVML
jgi:hypothetical protein